MRRFTRVLLTVTIAMMGACAPQGPTAFITQNIVPDKSCVVSPDAAGALYLPFGSFDVSSGKTSKHVCQRSYRVNLLVNSYLRPHADDPLGRAEPNILQIHSAKVTLMTLDGAVLDFGDTTKPNPFLTTTSNTIFPSKGSTPSTAIASVEVIPLNYVSYLANPGNGLIPGDIQAEIQIYGTTTGDTDIDLAPFKYTIELCSGCLTMCLKADITDNNLTPDDVRGDSCPDNAGADGRVCIDSGC